MDSAWSPQGFSSDPPTGSGRARGSLHLTCQQVKVEHQRPMGNIQLLPITVRKWENITMDFVTVLPSTKSQHDTIWVIVDRLTKSAHFLQVNDEGSLEKLA